MGASWALWEELQSVDWGREVRSVDQQTHVYGRVKDREVYFRRGPDVERIRALANFESHPTLRLHTGGDREEYHAAHEGLIYRVEPLRRKHVLDREWATLFSPASALADLTSPEDVRFVVWFG